MKLPKTKYHLTKICDEPLYAAPQSTQELFSIEGIDESGIFALTEKRYSKLYVLSDMNFAGVTDEEQKAIIISFSKVLKTIPCRFSFSVANERVDRERYRNRTLYALRGDRFDSLRGSYNKMIREKISEAQQGLYQSIYLTLTVKADSITEAKMTFGSIEGALRSAFIGIGTNGMEGSVMKPVPINERIGLLYNLMHLGHTEDYEYDFRSELHGGRDFINSVVPMHAEFGCSEFMLDGNYGAVYYAEEYPKSMESDIMLVLGRMNCAGFVTLNSELLDTGAFKQEIRRKYCKVGMKIENEKKRNRNNHDYLADASEKLLAEKEKMDAFLRQMDASDDHYFNTTMLVLLLAGSREELAAAEERLLGAASLKGVRLKPCFGKQREALNSVIPLGIQEFKRVTNLSSSCLAMFMPFKTQELNEEGGCFYGINQLSNNGIFADKKRLKNHNGLILGQSGSGKSVFAKSEIISTFINNPNDQIMIIDPQSEYGPLSKVVGGSIISFDINKENYINPMDVDFEGTDYGKLKEIIAGKADFILTLLSSCLKRDASPEEQSVIDAVVDRVYSENYSLRKRLNGEGKEASIYQVPGYMVRGEKSFLQGETLSNEEQIRNYSPTLQDIYQGLLDEESEIAGHLAGALDIFVNGSLNLFNHRTNVDMNNRFLVFDLSGLKDNLRVTSMLIMMEIVRERIRSGAKNNVWTHLYIDEFHELLAVEQIADFILKLWKEIRKLSGILNGITQNMSDLLSHENGAKLTAILSNTEYFALLSQSTLDKNKLMSFLPGISPAMFNFVDNADSGTGLLKMGSITVPFDMRMDRDSEIYRIVNTDAGGSYGV